MKDEIFCDTSIIIYAYDNTELEKKKVCKLIIKDVFRGKKKLVISNQVMAELFSVLTKTMRTPLEPEIAEKIVQNFIESSDWIKINYDIDTVKFAMSTSKIHKTHFWDVLIAETMKENGINKIYTENEKNFVRIPEIEVINPIKNI